MSTQLYAGLGFIACSIWYAQFCSKKRLQAPYPPGPPAHFLLGNVPDFPREKPWVKFEEWKQQYGDVVYLDMMGQPVVILNTREACIDLLDRRSAIYSNRPRLVMLDEIMGWEWGLPSLKYSNYWRAHRRMFHQHMNERAVQDHCPAQQRHAHTFLRNLLETPDKFLDHIRLSFAASIMDVVYDIKVEDFNDIYVQTAEAAMRGLSIAGVPGTFLVDTFPLLKYVPAWFPGAGFRKKGAKWKTHSREMFILPYEHVKRGMADGTAGPSIMASMLSRCDEEKSAAGGPGDFTEDIARNAGGISYAGGSDTTLATIQSFFLAMAKFPEVQKAAQAELDAVVGRSRLPTFEDRENLPYIQALMKETLRWHNVFPMAIAHASIQDDEYRGYFIPKGSIVIANAWSILHDPLVYPDPQTFKPERFLVDSPQGRNLNPDVPDIDPAFGFGRRNCPGRHFALNSLFITISTVLAAFDISAPLDATGKPTEIKAEATGNLISYPAPFKANITPRSQRAAQLVQESGLV